MNNFHDLLSFSFMKDNNWLHATYLIALKRILVLGYLSLPLKQFQTMILNAHFMKNFPINLDQGKPKFRSIDLYQFLNCSNFKSKFYQQTSLSKWIEVRQNF